MVSSGLTPEQQHLLPHGLGGLLPGRGQVFLRDGVGMRMYGLSSLQGYGYYADSDWGRHAFIWSDLDGAFYARLQRLHISVMH